MEFLEFPKFFRELSAEKLGETLKDIGFDGVDVMVRDGYWVTYDTLKDSLPDWRNEWTTLADGLVDWERVLKTLKLAGYDGPLCFHNFYEHGMEHLIARTREDVEYIRSILAGI